jgi:hypothetical protein
VIFPTTKITDIAVVAQLDRPSFVGREYLVVNTDGKQNGYSAPSFLSEPLRDFILNPLARPGPDRRS